MADCRPIRGDGNLPGRLAARLCQGGAGSPRSNHKHVEIVAHGILQLSHVTYRGTSLTPAPLPEGEGKLLKLISADLPLEKLPPLQGEGWGGDGANSAPKLTHPPPELPLEGGGTWTAEDFCASGYWKAVRRFYLLPVGFFLLSPMYSPSLRERAGVMEAQGGKCDGSGFKQAAAGQERPGYLNGPGPE
jgi:hypothetical protein